jgi:superfamily I DNA and/or RNA helicase
MSLQNGYKGSYMPTDFENIALYSGLSYGYKHTDILAQRHTLLTFQHRMHTDIAKFPRSEIYNGKALDPALGINEARVWPGSSPFPSYDNRSIWINIRPGSSQISHRTIKSNYNLAEVKAIIDKLKEFMEWSRTHEKTSVTKEKWSVAILSFYKGQAKKVSDELRKLAGTYNLDGRYEEFSSEEFNIEIKIGTVDRFQGQEADVVFLSFVRCCRQSPGFLDNINRLNVAITRAKYQLIIFGDRAFFKQVRNANILKKLAETSASGELSYSR